jgi:hypothetical protein
VPGKTHQLALDNYLHPLRSSLACVTDCRFAYTAATPNVEHPLTLAQPVARIESLAEQFGLFFYHLFKIQKAGKGYKVSTLGYRYGLEDGDQNEIVQYHWHPANGMNTPHLHVSCAGEVRPELHKAHLPCGRIAFEDFLLFLIEEFNIQAVDHYEKILIGNRKKFRDHCSWYWEPNEK